LIELTALSDIIMKYYILKNKEYLDFSQMDPNICKMYIEMRDEGMVGREVGINSDDIIVHAHPSDSFKYGEYGIFDLLFLEIDNTVQEISKEQFDKIWEKI
jgi:hypothetical protein